MRTRTGNSLKDTADDLRTITTEQRNTKKYCCEKYMEKTKFLQYPSIEYADSVHEH